MYRLAGVLGMRSTLNLIQSRIASVIPNSYGLPVCVLSVTSEGTCCLLDGNQCLVHEDKPAVCAMYPLGRIYDASTGKYTYIHPYGNTCIGSEKGTIMAAAQWLSGAEKEEVFHASCEQAYTEVLVASVKITNDHYAERVYARTVWALFCGFDPQKSFLPQLEENMACLRPLLRKAIKKSR